MGLRVLIVDDDRLLCAILVRQLAALGHHAFKAENGDEAIELASHQDFAAIFVDYELPNDNGVRVAKRLEALQPKATMILTSGWHQPTVAEALAGANMDRCRVLAKPWELAEVISILDEAAAAYHLA